MILYNTIYYIQYQTIGKVGGQIGNTENHRDAHYSSTECRKTIGMISIQDCIVYSIQYVLCSMQHVVLYFTKFLAPRGLLAPRLLDVDDRRYCVRTVYPVLCTVQRVFLFFNIFIAVRVELKFPPVYIHHSKVKQVSELIAGSLAGKSRLGLR